MSELSSLFGYDWLIFWFSECKNSYTVNTFYPIAFTNKTFQTRSYFSLSIDIFACDDIGSVTSH
jgi:hypothetical protein